MIFMQNQGCEGPCADYYQAKQQHSNLKTRYLLALWSQWVKFLVSSPAKTHQLSKRVTEQATWRLAGSVCTYMHFQYTKDKISRYQNLAQDLRLIYQIIISRPISLFRFSISLTTLFFPTKQDWMGKKRGQEKKQRNENKPLLNLPEATNSFHIKILLTIIHAKTCFDAHSTEEPTHLVLAFGFSKKLLYSIHGLLEALTLVNLYHFLFVRVIRLQLLHFDPSTRNQKKVSYILQTATFSTIPLLETHRYTSFLQSNWW